MLVETVYFTFYRLIFCFYFCFYLNFFISFFLYFFPFTFSFTFFFHFLLYFSSIFCPSFFSPLLFPFLFIVIPVYLGENSCNKKILIVHRDEVYKIIFWLSCIKLVYLRENSDSVFEKHFSVFSCGYSVQNKTLASMHKTSIPSEEFRFSFRKTLFIFHGDVAYKIGLWLVCTKLVYLQENSDSVFEKKLFIFSWGCNLQNKT